MHLLRDANRRKIQVSGSSRAQPLLDPNEGAGGGTPALLNYQMFS